MQAIFGLVNLVGHAWPISSFSALLCWVERKQAVGPLVFVQSEQHIFQIHSVLSHELNYLGTPVL